jgi:hypothetical protein
MRKASGLTLSRNDDSTIGGYETMQRINSHLKKDHFSSTMSQAKKIRFEDEQKLMRGDSKIVTPNNESK